MYAHMYVYYAYFRLFANNKKSLMFIICSLTFHIYAYFPSH